MTRMRYVIFGVLSAGILMAVAPLAGQARPEASGDEAKLAETLTELNMVELLEALGDPGQAADDPESKKALARAKTAQATDPLTPLDERARLLDEAIALWEQVVQASADPADDKELLEHLNDRLMLANTRGRVRIEPNTVKLMYLTGGPEDRRAVLTHTEPAVAALRSLRDTTLDTLQSWRGDFRRIVTVVPRLEDLQTQTRYVAMWVNLYRGLALEDDQARRQVLRDAIREGDSFARGEDNQWRYWALVVRAIAHRELDEFDQADKALDAADHDQAEPGARYQALFEKARNVADRAMHRVEQGKRKIKYTQDQGGKEDIQKGREAFSGFAEALDAFSSRAPGLVGGGQSTRLQTDIYAAMLAHYAHAGWAEALAGIDDPQADQHRQQAQDVLISFLEDHNDPAVQNFFYNLIADKYGQRTDYDQLNSVILMAVAVRKIGEGGQAEAKAIELLQKVLDRTDDTSRKVQPMALWQLGIVMNQRRKNIESATYFVQLARDHPDHKYARQAATNACRIYLQLIDRRRRQDQAISVNIRRQFVETLKVLLGREQWARQAPQWYFDLGWQSERLAQVAPSPERQRELYAQAIEAYDQVPPDSDQSMQARWRSLDLGIELLWADRQRGASERAIRGSAETLVNAMDRFVTDVARRSKAVEDDQRRLDLRRWGASADFGRAELMYEVLDQKDRALAEVRQLPGRWPSTDIPRVAREFVIRKLVDRGRVDEAIGEVEDFARQYKDQADQLLQLVVQKIRQRIGQMSSQAEAEELAQYRQVYLRFARKLYMSKQGLPVDQREGFQQLYADALLENGQGEQALELLEEIQQRQQNRREAAADRIDAVFERRVKAVNNAGRSVTAMRRQVDAYFELLDQYGYDRSQFAESVFVADAARAMDRAVEADEQTRRVERLADRLTQALEDLRRRVREAVPRDATTLLGLARAYHQTGQIDQSSKYYRMMIRGLDASQHPRLYWQVQLEYVRMLLEAHGDDPEAMGILAKRIKGLRLNNPSMGGFLREFAAVQIQAEQLAEPDSNPGR